VGCDQWLGDEESMRQRFSPFDSKTSDLGKDTGPAQECLDLRLELG